MLLTSNFRQGLRPHNIFRIQLPWSKKVGQKKSINETLLFKPHHAWSRRFKFSQNRLLSSEVMNSAAAGHGTAWLGMAWHGPWLGMAWDGLGWLGMAWDGLGWLGMAWAGMAWLGMATACHGRVGPDLAWHTTWNGARAGTASLRTALAWPLTCAATGEASLGW